MCNVYVTFEAWLQPVSVSKNMSSAFFKAIKECMCHTFAKCHCVILKCLE